MINEANIRKNNMSSMTYNPQSLGINASMVGHPYSEPSLEIENQMMINY
jgi:hypothetical protein